ncbi:GntR family transcriptional regulator [Streptomyces sp. NBC_00878]|uniref:GntR family transcriptional regulator n=1 Tax=Streptomyces sp. NBC_00878 TaxID=2975854 RepID=UPI002256C1B7|nr:GntR family transcriptional regulator [Streptomyces sp. NBC_00878]MCX4906714.1 GntR family transcriptional regulator [Streptomyces sp. NBC_00878]
MSTERGDGGGKEFERVLDALRTRIADGTYALKSQLPPQRELAEEFEVSRDTVQRVLRELSADGWVKSRQGSGTTVVHHSPIHSRIRQPETPRVRAALGPFIARAFAQPVVRLDVFTLTSESLDTHIRVQAERIRLGEVVPPERIELRMLLPSESLELPYPRARETVGDADVRRAPDELDRLQEQLQERLHAITRRHTESLHDALIDLKTQHKVPSVEVEIRHVPLAPSSKLYLRRDAEVLFGPYEVVERPILLGGDTVDALDVLGLESKLTRHVNDEGDSNAPGSMFIESMQSWFDSCWNLLAEGPPESPEPAEPPLNP